MSVVISPGSVDQSIVLRALDSTTFLPYTSIAYNTSGIDLWYWRYGSTITSITEATLAAVNTAHSDGGVIHLGNGYFRLDLPDAAVATGVDRVAVGGTATGVVIIGEQVLLNFITAAGIQTECNDALVANGLDHLIGASCADTDVADNSALAKLVSKSATADFTSYDNTTDSLEAQRDKLTDIETDTAEIGSAGAGLTALATQASVNTIDDFLDTEIAAILTDTGTTLDAALAVVDANVDAIKAKTDSLTFTNAGVVDANITHVISDAVQANSTKETKWGGT